MARSLRQPDNQPDRIDAGFRVGDRVHVRTTDGESIVGAIARVNPALPAPYEVEVDFAETEGLTDDAIRWYDSGHYAGPFKQEELTRVG